MQARTVNFFLAEEQITTDFSEIIAENFGANATYVEGLLARWQSDPSLVDESWRAYFEELFGPNGDRAAVSAAPAAAPSQESARSDGGGAAIAPAKKEKSEPTPAADAEVVPIRGPALKIVENMQASLTVPTATSQRRIPVRLLDENRRLINRHLEEAGHRK